MILKILALVLAAIGSITFLTKNNFSEFYLSNENAIIVIILFLLALFMMKTIIRLVIFAAIVSLVASSGYITNVSFADLNKDSISEVIGKAKEYLTEKIED